MQALRIPENNIAPITGAKQFDQSPATRPVAPAASIARHALKISEAAEALGVSQISVRRMIARGLLRPCRVLRHVLIPVAELQRLLGTA